MKKLILSVVALMAGYTLSAQSVTELYNEGAAAYQGKDFATAAAAFEKTIDEGMDSDDSSELSLVATAKSLVPKCYFQLGGRAFQTKNYDEAIANFTKSAELAEVYGDDSQAAKSMQWVGTTYTKQAEEPFNAGDYAAALPIFEKGYAANPKDLAMANNLATCYCETGQYAEGLAILKKSASSTNPKYAEQAAQAKELSSMYTNNMVAGFQQNNDYDGMIAVAEQMLASDPESPVANKVLVQAYAGKQDHAKVIELAESAAAVQTEPEDAGTVYYLLGLSYNAKEMKPQAIAALKKVTAGPSAEAAKAAVAELSK